MTGDEAMIEAVGGAKVRRVSWACDFYWVWEDGAMWQYSPDGQASSPVHLHAENMLGDNWEIFEEKGEEMEEMGLAEAVSWAMAKPGCNIVERNGYGAHWLESQQAFVWKQTNILAERRVGVDSWTLFGWRRVQEEPEGLDSKQAEAALKVGKRVEFEHSKPGAYWFWPTFSTGCPEGPWLHEAGGIENPGALNKRHRYRVIGEEPQPEPMQPATADLRPQVPEGYEAWEVENDSDTLRAVHGLEPVHAVFLTSVPDDPRFTGLYGYERCCPKGITWRQETRAWREEKTGRVHREPAGIANLEHLPDWQPILPRWVLMRSEGKADG